MNTLNAARLKFIGRHYKSSAPNHVTSVQEQLVSVYNASDTKRGNSYRWPGVAANS